MGRILFIRKKKLVVANRLRVWVTVNDFQWFSIPRSCKMQLHKPEISESFELDRAKLELGRIFAINFTMKINRLLLHEEGK